MIGFLPRMAHVRECFEFAPANRQVNGSTDDLRGVMAGPDPQALTLALLLPMVARLVDKLLVHIYAYMGKILSFAKSISGLSGPAIHVGIRPIALSYGLRRSTFGPRETTIPMRFSRFIA